LLGRQRPTTYPAPPPRLTAEKLGVERIADEVGEVAVVEDRGTGWAKAVAEVGAEAIGGMSSKYDPSYLEEVGPMEGMLGSDDFIAGRSASEDDDGFATLVVVGLVVVASCSDADEEGCFLVAWVCVSAASAGAAERVGGGRVVEAVIVVMVRLVVAVVASGASAGAWLVVTAGLAAAAAEAAEAGAAAGDAVGEGAGAGAAAAAWNNTHRAPSAPKRLSGFSMTVLVKHGPSARENETSTCNRKTV